MRLVCMSDIHSKFKQLGNIPDGDVFVYAGDWSLPGNESEMHHFAAFLMQLPHKYKVVIAGNHDWAAERLGRRETRRILTLNGSNTSVRYLEHESCIINDVFFFGSPFTPNFGDWAYMLPFGSLKRKWDQIPDETNVLITHGPPFGIGDISLYGMQNAGCPYLSDKTSSLPNLKVHVYGHIHFSYGLSERNGVRYVNASTCTEKYEPTNPAFVVDI